MAYLGNKPATSFTKATKDTFSGDGSTTAFTLSKIATTNDVEVFVENVQQEPTSAYGISGTTLTFTAAPPSGTSNVYVIHRSPAIQTVTHPSTQNLQAVDGKFTGVLKTDTIKKADGTGSITVPANTGTLVDTSGAAFTGDVSTTAQFSTNAQGSASDPAYAVTSGSIGVNGMYVPEANGLAFATGATERARFNSGTGLLIGTTNNSPAEDASVNGVRLGYNGGCQIGASGTEVVRINRNTNDGRIIGLAGQSSVRGEIAVSGTTIQYTSYSDHRLKENVQSISNGIGLVKTLNPVNFDWIETGQNVNGFLAHEVQTVVPEAVTGTHNEVDDEGNPVYQGIDQSKLVPLLTGALQEAIAKIETLETTVADLQTRVTALEAP